MADQIEAQDIIEILLAQIAAESYLHNDALTFEQQFVLGANSKSIDQFPDGQVSATQSTDLMLDDFNDTWTVEHHEKNTSSGFSATLLKHKEDNQFMLAFRSTESKDAENGGDVLRDSGDGANGEILSHGFALGQLMDMEKWYNDLKAPGGPLANAENLFVTGYSLGALTGSGLTFDKTSRPVRSF